MAKYKREKLPRNTFSFLRIFFFSHFVGAKVHLHSKAYIKQHLAELLNTP